MKKEPIETVTRCIEPGFLKLAISKDVIGHAASETIVAPEPDFQKIAGLCQGGPVRFNGRPTPEEIEVLEDEQDVKNALQSLKDPDSVSLDDLKKQLGI